ncbi:C40 family peptidase [Microbacter margulisiae]|uniref:NlpC/P60 domain-containing protein n=1 Tax=Microbacter margulisiae TaxID=1350067 RepID=A0A7W5H1Q5_9PORP|nr:C40 family peptidase [Microbacter margulisiae]MBB3186621.1 hypothetical protein [Microbacter margulisiae]
MNKLIKLRDLLLWCLVLAFFGCGTSRHLEKKQDKKAVYEALGLNKGRKDNFALYKEAAGWLHVPHVDGGTSRKGTDCSFLVYTIYKTVYGKILERNSEEMLRYNCKRIRKKKLKEGDLVFFDTTGKPESYVNHVGIYLKENKFLHASTSKGVVVSNLSDNYYLKTWVCGGRVK